MRKIMKRLLAHTLVLGMIIPSLPYGVAHAAEGIQIDEEHFPDAGFRSYVSEGIDFDRDGFLSEKECNDVFIITMDPSNWSKRSISSLAGIELFPNLESLTCTQLQLTELDMSQNPMLKRLYCSHNQLTRLIVSNNLSLEILSCDYNQLSELDVSNNTALTQLDCSVNQLTELDLGSITGLTTLSCRENQLTELNLNNNTALQRIDIGTNQLTDIDLSSNSELVSLNCYNNQLSDLELKNNTKIISLSCGSNQLATLDVNKCTALLQLYCGCNRLTDLDLSGNSSLTTLDCDFNELNELDLKNCPNLTYVGCLWNKLTKLNVTQNQKLTQLSCGYNQLTELDVSHNTLLTELECYKNQLNELVVEQNCAIERLECYDNKLLELDVSRLNKLLNLSCSNNQLMTLNVTENELLGYLSCGGNIITDLDVSNNPNLRGLDCHANQLTELDVSNNPELIELRCNENPLRNLDLSRNPKLQNLYSFTSTIILLDLRNNPLIESKDYLGFNIIVYSDEDLGWYKLGQNTYYVFDNGTTPKTSHLATGLTEIDGVMYRFDENGVLQGELNIPTEITVNPATVTMTVWDTMTLKAETEPEEISADELVWRSEDTSVVQVDSEGVLTPVAEGTTTVTVASIYDKSIMFIVPVTVKPVITLEVGEMELLSGEEKESRITRNTSMITELKCKSRNPDIASAKVTGEGLSIQGESEGETVVTLTVYEKEGGKKTFTIHVTVSGMETVNTEITRIELYYNGEKITEDDEISAYVDDSLDFTAKIYTSDDKEYDYSFDESVIQTENGRIRLSWNSSNPSVASVNRGNVGITAAGMAYISAKAVGSETMSDAIEINAEERPIELRRLAISGATELEVGEASYLKPIYTPLNAANKDIRWESEDPSIAEVSEYGMIVGRALGTTKITLTSLADETIFATVDVEVLPDSVKEIGVEKGTRTGADGAGQFKAEKTLAEGDEIILRHNLDREFYIRTTVNEGAAEKGLGVVLRDAEGEELEVSDALMVQDVSEEFTGLTEQNQVFCVTAEGIGESVITIRALDWRGKEATFTVKVNPYDEWYKDKDGNLRHYTQEAMDTGLTTIEGNTYFFDADGIMQTGLQESDGNKYFFGADGVMQKGWQDIDGKRYYFGKDGAMLIGWQRPDGKWYYLGDDGAMQTGWQLLKGKWYYFEKSGPMITGWKKIGKKWYYFSPASATLGEMQTGWQKSNGKWYYLSPASATLGEMQTGWQKIDGKWYYFSPASATLGEMQTGWKKIDGSWYYFKGGVMVTGWQQISGKWYFFKNGAMLTGWLKSGGKWYYFNSDGEMVTGSVKIGTKTYQFNSSGVCLNP